MRYACEYVAKKLYQMFLKQNGEKYAKYATFVECLNRNNVDSMHPVTYFMDY